VGNEPFLLPLLVPPLPAFGFWFNPVGSEPCVPPPPAVAPKIGASRATPTVAVATPSMTLSRFVIIVAPCGRQIKSPQPIGFRFDRRPSRLWVDGATTASNYHTPDRVFLMCAGN